MRRTLVLKHRGHARLLSGLDRPRHRGVRLTLRLGGVASESAESGALGRDRRHEHCLYTETSVSSTPKHDQLRLTVLTVVTASFHVFAS